MPAATLTLDNAKIEGGIVSIVGLLDSTGASFVAGAAVTNTGTIEATAGTLTIDPGSIENSGTLEANSGTLEIDNTPATNTGALSATAGGTLVLNDDAITNTGGTVQVHARSALDLQNTSAISGGAVIVYNGGTLTFDNAGDSIGHGRLTNFGTFDTHGIGNTLDAETVINDSAIVIAGALTLKNGTAITNSAAADTITVAYNGMLTLDDSSSISGGTLVNSGTLNADGSNTLDDVTVANYGAIDVGATGAILKLDGDLVIDGTVTLDGAGTVTLDGTRDDITGATGGGTLDNVGNAIAGTGQIGSGDGHLSLVNEAPGTIDANIAGGTLTLATGTAITNDGTLEATNGGTLLIDDPVSGGGSAIIEGGTLEFGAEFEPGCHIQ